MCGVAVGCSWYDWSAIVAIIAARWEPLQYRYFDIYNHLPSYTIPWASKPIKIQGCTIIPEVSCKTLGIFCPLKIWVGVKYWFSTGKVLAENPKPEVFPWNPGCSSACGHTRGYFGTREILQVLGDYSGNKLVNMRCMDLHGACSLDENSSVIRKGLGESLSPSRSSSDSWELCSEWGKF
jgi:hypothetical protein